MPSAMNILLGAIPGLLWLAYFWRKDKLEREPLHILLRVFFLGACAAFAVAHLRPRLEFWLLPPDLGLAHDLADAFLVTAGGEECFKLLAFTLGALWHADWDEPMDGIVYGAAAGLGFASLENAYYLTNGGDSSLVVARAFTANLAHVLFSSGVGFAFGLAKLRGKLSFAPIGIVGALFLHGVYDLFLFSHPEWSLISLLGVLPLGLGLLGLKMRWSQARSPHAAPSKHNSDSGPPSQMAA